MWSVPLIVQGRHTHLKQAEAYLQVEAKQKRVFSVKRCLHDLQSSQPIFLWPVLSITGTGCLNAAVISKLKPWYLFLTTCIRTCNLRKSLLCQKSLHNNCLIHKDTSLCAKHLFVSEALLFKGLNLLQSSLSSYFKNKNLKVSSSAEEDTSQQHGQCQITSEQNITSP